VIEVHDQRLSPESLDIYPCSRLVSTSKAFPNPVLEASETRRW
jgi:hypothetical protein